MTPGPQGGQAPAATSGDLAAATLEQMRSVMTRYPRTRSAIMPMLHLVQADQGCITEAGVETVAGLLGLAPAEVAAVASFYTMYVDKPVGEYHVGVCTNTLCGLLGGDAIWAALTEDLGIGHHGVTPDGRVSLERIECQAACTHAPVMTANWEFLDNQTVESAREVVARLRAGETVESTRGPVVGTWRQTERLLGGVDDGQAAAGGGADPLMRAGLDAARERASDDTPAKEA